MDRLEFGGPKEGFEVYSAYVLGWRPSGAHVKNKEPTRPRHSAGGRVVHLRMKRSHSTKPLGLEPSCVTKTKALGFSTRPRAERSCADLSFLDDIDRIQRELREQQATSTPAVMANEVNANELPGNIGAGDAPRNHHQRAGIVPPPIQNNNFEIKSGLISMIQSNKFHGLPMEDPLDHLDNFDRLCSLTKINGVSEDSFKLRLFPFSLGDKAHLWEKTFPVDSVDTWDDCKKAFLAKFFSNSRTARLRNEISGFNQKNSESFAEAWERFKGYTTQCPHHGFKKASLLSTLYRAQSDENYNEDYDRTNRGSSDSEDRHKKEIKALNDKIDKLVLAQQRNVHYITEEELTQLQEGENLTIEENQPPQAKPFIPYNQGYNQKQNFGPPGFTQQPQQTSAQDSEMKTLLHQLLQGQASCSMTMDKKLAELTTRIDCSYNDLNIKIDALNTRVKTMEGHIASTSAPKHPGQLPGKSVQNPKEYAHAITTVRTSATEDSGIQEGEVLRPKSRQEIELDFFARLVERAYDPSNPIPIPPAYEPKPYFPERIAQVNARIFQKHKMMFIKCIKELEEKIPLVDTPKEVIMERPQEAQQIVELSFECSAIIQRKVIPKKLGDPGSFTLPCSLGPLVFNNSLCDLGASVSLMPLSVAKRLGFDKLKPSSIHLILADRSVRVPHGMLEDLPVKIGSVEIPTDFVVLEMDEEPKDPLILGRPFLATAGALIDVQMGKIDLNLGKNLHMSFDIAKKMKNPTIEGQFFFIEEGNLDAELLSGLENPIPYSIPTRHLGEPEKLLMLEGGPSLEVETKGNNFDVGPIARELMELRKQYGAQGETMEKLDLKMEELNYAILELKEMIKGYPGPEIDEYFEEPDLGEEDYSTDEKEAYFEERSNEYSTLQLSRENAEYDSDFEDSTRKKTSREFQATLDRTTRLQAECRLQSTKGPRLNSTRPTPLGPRSSMDLTVQRPNMMQHSARSRVRKRSPSGPTLYSTRASINHPKIMNPEESRRRTSARAVARGFEMINEKNQSTNQKAASPGFTRMTGRVQWPSMAPESSEGRSAAAQEEIARGKRVWESEPVAEEEVPEIEKEASEEDVQVDEEVPIVPTSRRRNTMRRKKEPTIEEHYQYLMELSFEGTRYPHRPTMQALGICRDVDYLMEMAKLETFFSYQYEGYKTESCQFLATLKLHFYAEERERELHKGVGYITFMVFGIQYSVPIRQLDAIFKFPTKYGIRQNFSKDELLDLWLTIAGPLPYKSSRAKSSLIRSPVLRYLHICIASAFFPKKTTGHVNEGELKLLDLTLCFILGHTRNGIEMEGDRADTSLSVVLIDHLIGFREYAAGIHQSGYGGSLCAGGVITPILIAAGVPLHTPTHTATYIDMEYLKRKCYLDRSAPADQLYFKFKHSTLGLSRLALPCKKFTTIRIGNNIDFDPPQSILVNVLAALQAEPSIGSESQEEGAEWNEEEAEQEAYTRPSNFQQAEYGQDEFEQAEFSQAEQFNEQEDSCEAAAEQFFFEDYAESDPERDPGQVHKKLGMLKGLGKFQRKLFSGLKKKVRKMKRAMDGMAVQIQELQRRQRSPPPRPEFRRSNSTSVAPRRDARFDPPRASNYELGRSSTFSDRRFNSRPPGPVNQLVLNADPSREEYYSGYMLDRSTEYNPNNPNTSTRDPEYTQDRLDEFVQNLFV
ncbi:Retrotransposon gag domain [Arabidopsis suecica]|uniref:Retrotransposon gag domain n=1 Tax=Arabidopsis suecica TaxID=45249 RepID=A0A8T1XCT9_ARASU|nr:Retrotransposon gag domain [Arabidopsis suecica]